MGDIGNQTLKRDRFKAILNNLHLVDNTKKHGTNRLFKIRFLIERFNKLNNKIYSLLQKMCIDESLVPFLARLFFRPYIPNKRDKYGDKIIQTVERGYTRYMQKKIQHEQVLLRILFLKS